MYDLQDEQPSFIQNKCTLDKTKLKLALKLLPPKSLGAKFAQKKDILFL